MGNWNKSNSNHNSNSGNYQRGNNQNYSNNRSEKSKMEKLTTDNYTEIAEQTINKYGREITTTKLRSLLTMTIEVYNNLIQKEENSENSLRRIKEMIAYFKIRCLYEAARERKVKDFIEGAFMADYLEEIIKIDNMEKLEKEYKLFTRYMEALVAYRSYKYGMR